MSADSTGPLGVIPRGWQLISIKNISTKIGSGATPRGGEAVYLKHREKFAFVRSQNVFDYYFDSSEIRYISNEQADKLNGAQLNEDDLLLNITGDGVTFGRSCIIPKEILPAAVNQHVSIIRLNKALCLPEFLLAYLCHPVIKDYIASFNAGGSRRAITKGNIESFMVSLPPMVVQEKIQGIALVLNKKIELNRQLNQTLEEIAQALFKSWFVDFEPTKAKIKAKRSSQRPPLPPGEGPGVREPLPPHLLANARRLRQQLTDAERLLWQLLRGRQLAGCKFRRQHPIGNFILDFYCHDKQLAVELDGGQHNGPSQREADERRTAWLTEQGVRVLRFWNNEVLQKTEGVLEEIFRHLTGPGPGPHPRPLSRGERGEEVVADFVERAAMCAISGKTDDELDQLSSDQFAQLLATAALFPDELVESELGLIPKGWEWTPLSKMVHLIGGGTPKRSHAEYWGGEIPWFSVQDAPLNGDVFCVNTEEKITGMGLEKSSTKILPVGTTIISARGTVGRLALVGIEMAMNQSCYGVRGINSIGPYFNYFNLKNAISTLQQNTHGAVFDTITRQTFDTVTCLQPSASILDVFELTMTPLMKYMQNNLHARASLTQLRDTLLPKLLSGEISVDQAGADIKEAI